MRDEPLGLTVHCCPRRKKPSRPMGVHSHGRWKMIGAAGLCGAGHRVVLHLLRGAPRGPAQLWRADRPAAPAPTLATTALDGSTVHAAPAQGPVAAGQRGGRRLRRHLPKAPVPAAPAAREPGQGQGPARLGLAGARCSEPSRPPPCCPAMQQATVLRVDAAQLAQWLAAGRRASALRRPPVCGGPHGQLDDALSGGEPGRQAHASAAKIKTWSGCCARPRRGTRRAGPDTMDAQPLYDLAPAAAADAHGRGDCAGAAGLGVAAQPRAAACAAPAGAHGAHAVPDLRPGAVWRLHAADRFGPGLPRLAGLLRQRQPGGRARDITAAQTAMPTGPGHARQGLGRDDPPLPGHRCGRADHLLDAGCPGASWLRASGKPGRRARQSPGGPRSRWCGCACRARLARSP
jgi:hypothetical protein